MRARSWPFFTAELKSTRISLIWPEICEPTCTVVTAVSVPEAETVAVMATALDLGDAVVRGRLAWRVVAPAGDAGRDGDHEGGEREKARGKATAGGGRGHLLLVSVRAGEPARVRPSTLLAAEPFLLLLGDLAPQRAQPRLDHRRARRSRRRPP